jgi:DNA gyrase subunit A
VRRNLLSDFVDIRANGKIAMKLGDTDQLVAVNPCAETDDILLATRLGKAIRFPVEEVRVFKGRDSTGVRGIRLEKEDKVISMSVLNHVDFDSTTRDAFLKGEMSGPESERLAALQQFILTMTETGYGKRTSAYEYRVTGRGGQGIGNIELSERNSAVVASFPVTDEDEIMLVSDGGTLIRMPVDDIRIAGRLTQGVTLFRTQPGEKVVSAARLCDIAGADDDEPLSDDENLSEDTGTAGEE